jgi:hypothetical protein
VSVLLLGRVIVGDIAVTLVDLALRELLTIEPADGDDWTLTVASVAGAGPAGDPVADYERRLLAGLKRAGAPVRLSALASGFGKHMDKARSEIVAGAVHDGWIRRFQHDQRTSKGEELAVGVRAFQRSLRRAMPELAQDVLDGPLLPYAMRGGLATDEGIPLVRFAHAAVRTLVTEPGWTPPQPEGKTYDERWRTDIETMMRGAVPY